MWIPFSIVHLIVFGIFYKKNSVDINSNFTTNTYFILMASYELLDLHFCLNDPKYKNDILMNQHHIGAIFSSLIILSVESDFNHEITSFYAVYCSLLGSSNILMNFRYFVILLCSNKMINLVNYLFAGYFLVVRVVGGNIFGDYLIGKVSKPEFLGSGCVFVCVEKSETAHNSIFEHTNFTYTKTH